MFINYMVEGLIPSIESLGLSFCPESFNNDVNNVRVFTNLMVFLCITVVVQRRNREVCEIYAPCPLAVFSMTCTFITCTCQVHRFINSMYTYLSNSFVLCNTTL